MKKIITRGIGALIVVLILLWTNLTFLDIDPDEFRNWILSFGWFAPLFYIVLYTIRPLILFPASIFTIVGGLAFGVTFGIIFALIGATSGAIFSFFVARKVSSRFMKKKWTGVAETIESQLKVRGFLYILALRLMPVINFDLISYVSGFSNVRFKPYFFATFFGIIPGTIAYNLLGASFVEQNPLTIILAILMFIILILIPLILRRKFKGKLDM
ncbi:TVP38/TMEM64 family protein [Halalkalibacter urbisdiaboli]|uniref:TVP38/TMEM64 family protein n=1 Tax=Halalkalibacter urbisdiaboli TaxID=1960589 RepID=UPI000B45171A|nr:TVP38/TMEM64 family protein [Halalkalibacter urbisdiaboli]